MRATITVIAILLGLAVVGGMFYHATQQTNPDQPDTPAVADGPTPSGAPGQPGDEDAPATPPDTDDEVDQPEPGAGADVPTAAQADPPATADPQPKSKLAAFDGLTLVETSGQGTIVIGSDDPASGYLMRVELTSWGAGVKRLTLTEYAMGADGAQAEERYVILDTPERKIAPFAATGLTINGTPLNLVTQTQWAAQEPVEDENGVSVTLVAAVQDAAGNAVAEVRRVYRLEKGTYDLRLDQAVVNRSGEPIDVAFVQYGQGDMIRDPAAYLGDRREYVTGYFNPNYDAKQRIYTKGAHISRSQVIDDKEIWPNPELGDGNGRYKLAWIAAENRYFAIVIHAPIARDLAETSRVPELTQSFPDIGVSVQGSKGNGDEEAESLKLTLTRPTTRIAPGQSLDLGLAVFAGPRKKQVLGEAPYSTLYLERLIRYNIGGPCSFCTFQWLAKGLIGFLRLIHSATGDWAVAIVVLVIFVRLLLHPITKKAQINMTKMGKQMASLQPEIEKIKKKYKDDQQKLNAEMMKLYREKGVNPAGFLGCAPMMLQTPIWIALYAMLYFAIELRHEAAFYGLFQGISGGHWHFLQDLSVSDNFIRFIDPDQPGFHIPLVSNFLGPVRALNILPLMMGVVFYINQKFTTPPPANEQQAQQQKIMKFMVLLFPVFMYNAPSGLTLYIFTSTLFGILDGYMVRKHIREAAASGALFEKKPRKEGGFMDRMSKVMEKKQLEMQARQREAQKGQGGPPRGKGGKKRKR